MGLRKAITGTAVLLGLLCAFGCSREPVVAKVNGEAITGRDVKLLLEHAGIKESGGAQQAEGTHKGLRQELLNQLINEKLVLQAAKKGNIRVEKIELMKAYDNVVAGTAMKEEDFLKKLKERGMSRDRFLKSLEDDLMIQKFRDTFVGDIKVPENDMREYYDKNLSSFTLREQVRLSLVKVNDLGEAKRIRSEIERGARFEDMARKYPGGHREPGGGETGWVSIDSFPGDIAKEIARIRAGSFAGPIKGKEGYYLIKVIEKKERKVTPYDQVRENIRHLLIQQKLNEKFQAWLENERKQAKIEIVEKG